MSDLIKIHPTFNCPTNHVEEFQLYAKSIQRAFNRILKDRIKPSIFEEEALLIKELSQQLPIISWDVSKEDSILSLTCIAPAHHTQGLGRFLCDHSSRWLIPGKQLPLIYVNSLSVRLEKAPSCPLYFHEQFVKISNEEELNFILENIESFTHQLKMTILTVVHSRNIVTQKQLTFEEKKMIIKENIATLLGEKQKPIDNSLYDHTHRFMMKMISEEKVNQFKKSLSSMIDLKPQIFDREVFHELQDHISGFPDEFIACRDLKHLTRITSYQYLFKKNILHAISTNPTQRQVYFKTFQTHLKNSQESHAVLGVVVSLNFIKENEVFDEKHLFESIQACLSDLSKVNGSFYESRPDKMIRTLYLEVKKETLKPFSSQEIAIIKKRLQSEIKTRIESVYSPIFMPKNEEEVLKNILILSGELKYVSDLPQLYVSFQKQSETKLWFTVILLRVVKNQNITVKALFKQLNPNLKIDNLEVKFVGLLRKKYPKEAIVVDICLNKQNFLRKDFSVDLYEARRILVQSLEGLFGEIRDYNGGIISKQNEALMQLRHLLNEVDIQNDFLVENYFYSLSPSFMTSIIPTHVIRKQFYLVLKALETPQNTQSVFFEVQYVDQYSIILLASSDDAFKDFMLKNLDREELNAASVTFLNMSIQELFFIGYIYKTDQDHEEKELISKIIQLIKKWKKKELFSSNEHPYSKQLVASS